jgi:hypothetical protein
VAIFASGFAHPGAQQPAELRLVDVIPLRGDTHHVQGIEVDGLRLWVTSVDRSSRRALLFVFDLPGFDSPRLAAFYQELLGHLEHLPGVQSASLSMNTPLSGAKHAGRVSVNRQPQPGTAHFNAVARGYFRTLGTPLLLGRDFTLQDGHGATPPGGDRQ